MFIAIKDDFKLEKNYTMLTSVLFPIQASLDDEKKIESYQILVLIDLFMIFVIPCILSIILKSKIDRVFSLYHMLLLVGNLENLENIVIPASMSPII